MRRRVNSLGYTQIVAAVDRAFDKAVDNVLSIVGLSQIFNCFVRVVESCLLKNRLDFKSSYLSRFLSEFDN